MIIRRQQDALRVGSVSLPPLQRLALALLELEGLRYAEIASMLDLGEAEVARSIADARERLGLQLGIGEARPPDVRALCRLMVPLLSAHLDGETKGMRLEDVTDHLAGCERCQAEFDCLQEVQQRYRTLIPPPPVDTLTEQIGVALAARGILTARKAPRPSRRRIVAAAVALAALALVGLGVSRLDPSSETRRADVPTFPTFPRRPRPPPRRCRRRRTGAAGAAHLRCRAPGRRRRGARAMSTPVARAPAPAA